jgi:uncharacterized damage-inducible protein DinB
MQTTEPILSSVITPEQFFAHWQGHRLLTRKVIEAFPEEHLFNYSIGGMRPFAQLVMEMLDLADGGIEGAATGKWKTPADWAHASGQTPQTKMALLTEWDKVTVRINVLAPHVSPSRFQESEAAFGVYEGTIYSSLLYFIDNEIHHRGQGYVYLRSLGITPPPFWERQ